MKAIPSSARLPSALPKPPFVKLPENRFTRAAILRLAAKLCRPSSTRTIFPLVYLHGPPGCGKSHLAQWLLETIITHRSDAIVRLIPARDLGRLLADTATNAQATIEFRDCDLLIAEDVQHLPAASHEAVSQLMDHRLARGRLVLVTANTGPAQLRELSTRLASRLSGGLAVGISSMTLASRRKLAACLIRLRRLRVQGDVLDWLAQPPAGGARPMLGQITRLEELYRQHPRVLDMSAIRMSLGVDDVPSRIDQIADSVAQAFGITRKQLKSRTRQRHLVWPRQVGMFLARRATDFSLPRIGAYFGGYDHSTVLHSCRKVEERLTNDISLPGQLAQLMTLSS